MTFEEEFNLYNKFRKLTDRCKTHKQFYRLTGLLWKKLPHPSESTLRFEIYAYMKIAYCNMR